MESIVRLAALRISNMKNVEDGRIVMPHFYHRELFHKTAEVLGIYGQNGSGKTAIVDTLYYLQQIMIGETLSDEIAEYMDVNSEHTEVVADFHIYKDAFLYEVSYFLVLKKKKKEIRF